MSSVRRDVKKKLRLDRSGDCFSRSSHTVVSLLSSPHFVSWLLRYSYTMRRFFKQQALLQCLSHCRPQEANSAGYRVFSLARKRGTHLKH